MLTLQTSRRTTCAAVACMLLALIAWAYWPGLAGPFLFDDFANLNDLGAYGPLKDWTTLLYYVTSGTADPTGRPVAMLTFLLDAQDWPADPWPFKRTNLIIHIVNTALLGWVVVRLQAALQRRRPAMPSSAWTPLLAAALWGAHPFFVSTTLYVVQREAMLPMTFVLLALLAWDRAVLRFSDDKRTAGWLWATLGFGGCTLLAGLSKANGFLAPLLVGLAYLWCLRPTAAIAQRRSMDFAAIACLAFPSLIVLGYLFNYGFDRWAEPYLHGRDWTLPERLLSQPRALWNYVWHLVLPRSGGGGLFVEGFQISRSWTNPWTTLPSLLGLFASILAALAWRQRFPIASFAWLFFLCAHLLESSVIALELYFEHRNYLPAALLGWPVAHFLLRPGAYLRYRAGFGALLLVAYLLLTYQRATVWGNPGLLSALAAAHQVDSLRAQVSAAQLQVEHGDSAEGVARLQALQRANPDSVIVAVNAVGLECAGTGQLTAGTLARAENTLATARNWNHGLYTWMRDSAYAPSTRQCRGFGLEGLRAMLGAAERNPQNNGDRRRRDLWHVRGQIELAAGQPDAAFHWFNAALELAPDADYALVQAAALGNAGAQAHGMAHLAFYRLLVDRKPIRIRDMRSLHRWLLHHQGYYREQITYLCDRLMEDATDSAPLTDCAPPSSNSSAGSNP